jgi:UPF0755 protein
MVLLAAALACGPEPGAEEVVQVTIPPGASLAAAAESLAAHGLISSTATFRFYAVLSGRGRAVQAGTYDLRRGASSREILKALMAGRPPERRLVILEGLTLEEIADTVERQLGIPAESLRVAAQDPDLRTTLGVPAPTLEGYLFPSTHFVRADASAHDLVRQLTAEFERHWRTEWTAQLNTLGMTRHEVVTLASIIEGEVRHDADRAYVSSVYHNRLRSGMRLQADPTIVYALGRRRRLFERDYLTPSPYNTYLNDGLPPGPVGSPSAASMRAALFPAHTQFLYLVARPDGQHVFSRTYAEHLRAIREIRSGRTAGPSATTPGATGR